MKIQRTVWSALAASVVTTATIASAVVPSPARADSATDPGYLLPVMIRSADGLTWYTFDDDLLGIGYFPLDEALRKTAWVHVDRLSAPSQVTFADGSCLTNVADPAVGQRAAKRPCSATTPGDQMWTAGPGSLSVSDPIVAGSAAISYYGRSSAGLAMRPIGAQYTNFATHYRSAPLQASVESVDAAHGSASIRGRARPGSTLLVNDEAQDRVPVTSDGFWSYEARGLHSGSNPIRFDEYVGQVKSGSVRADVELDSVQPPDPEFEPVTVENTSVTAGVANTFRGSATPGASIRVLNISHNQIVAGPITADTETGAWTFERVVSLGAPNFRFEIEQTTPRGVDVSRLFTIPAE